MAKKPTVVLEEDEAGFVEAQIASGRYETASAVVSAALRLLEEEDAKVKALERALIAGEQSGPPEPFDFEAFRARKRAERQSTKE
ncbi:MAG: type II toxin-antitoxin system ParD family antitoxin [Pseudomonadota bacterium]